MEEENAKDELMTVQFYNECDSPEVPSNVYFEIYYYYKDRDGSEGFNIGIFGTSTHFTAVCKDFFYKKDTPRIKKIFYYNTDISQEFDFPIKDNHLIIINYDVDTKLFSITSEPIE